MPLGAALCLCSQGCQRKYASPFRLGEEEREPRNYPGSMARREGFAGEQSSPSASSPKATSRTPDPCIYPTRLDLVYWSQNGFRERVAVPTQRHCPRT